MAKCRMRLDDILHLEAEIWQFRAKMKWVEENEASTKFFFMRVKSNRGKSNVGQLRVDEEGHRRCRGNRGKSAQLLQRPL